MRKIRLSTRARVPQTQIQLACLQNKQTAASHAHASHLISLRTAMRHAPPRACAHAHAARSQRGICCALALSRSSTEQQRRRRRRVCVSEQRTRSAHGSARGSERQRTRQRRRPVPRPARATRRAGACNGASEPRGDVFFVTRSGPFQSEMSVTTRGLYFLLTLFWPPILELARACSGGWGAKIFSTEGVCARH